MKEFSSQLRGNCDYDSLWEICGHYGGVLEDNSNTLFMLPIRPESDLKIPKITIKRSLSALILIEGNRDAVSELASTYLFIEDFVEDDIYNYLLPYLKTAKDIEDNPPEYSRHLGEVFKKEEFLEAFNKARKLIKQRRDPLIDKLNFLLQLAEREDLMVNEELIKNKEQSQ